MGIQNTINLRMNRQTPGAQVSGGNARTTRTAAWKGDTTEAGSLFGKLVARGDQPWECRPLASTDTIKNIFGIALDDKLQQNAPANSGVSGIAYINQDYPLLIGTYGGFTMSHLGDISFGVDLYVITSDTTTPDNVGYITNSATAGDTRLLIGGPSYTGATSLVQPYETAVSGSTQPIEVQINNI